ncbi:MAG: hypothetical protein QOF60_135 [Actinomycetota bacterium]|jgi:hypothetical protein|nr:hypothetical protein [Actinomycetota bacterium]
MTDQDTTAAADSARVTKATREAERREATMPADAGPEPTADEAAAAEGNDVDPEVAKANKEAVERGADVKGEGRIA